MRATDALVVALGLAVDAPVVNAIDKFAQAAGARAGGRRRGGPAPQVAAHAPAVAPVLERRERSRVAQTGSRRLCRRRPPRAAGLALLPADPPVELFVEFRLVGNRGHLSP